MGDGLDAAPVKPWLPPDLPPPQPAPLPDPSRRPGEPAAASGERARAVPLSPAEAPRITSMDLVEVMDGSFRALRRNPKATLGLSAVVVTVQQLLVVAVHAVTGNLPTAVGFLSDTTSLTLVDGLGTVIGLLLSAVVGAVLTGMIVVVVAEDVLGRHSTVGEVWRRLRPRTAGLLLAALITGVLPFVGLALLVLPGLVLWAGWALTIPVLVLERLGPLQSIRRSWQLVRPDLWRVWSIRAVAAMLAWVIQSLLALPLLAIGTALVISAADDGSGRGRPLLAAVAALAGVVGGTVAAPFLSGVLALIYVDRRVRAEGLDLVLLQHARQGTPGGDAGAGAPAARFAAPPVPSGSPVLVAPPDGSP